MTKQILTKTIIIQKLEPLLHFLASLQENLPLVAWESNLKHLSHHYTQIPVVITIKISMQLTILKLRVICFIFVINVQLLWQALDTLLQKFTDRIIQTYLLHLLTVIIVIQDFGSLNLKRNILESLKYPDFCIN